MSKLNKIFNTKKWEITISPVKNSIQVEVAKAELDNYYFDCIDIPLNDLKRYAKNMGYFDSCYAIYEIIEAMENGCDLPDKDFNIWLEGLDDLEVMMLVLNFINDKKVVPC